MTPPIHAFNPSLVAPQFGARSVARPPIDKQTPETMASGATVVTTALTDPKYTRLLPAIPVADPVAAIDVGSNTVKVLLRKPDGSLHLKRYSVYLGASVGETNRIEPEYEEKLRDVFTDVAKFLFEDNGVTTDHVSAVATAALRDAENGQDMIDMANNLGLPLKTIDGLQEAELVYGAVLKGTKVKPSDKTIVLECGGGSTELAYGRGPMMFQSHLSSMAPFGTSRAQLEDISDPSEILRVRRDVRDGLDETVSDRQRREAKDRQVYIKNYWYFAPIVEGKPKAEQQEITRADIRKALQPQGLVKLGIALQGTDMQLPNLVAKLLIIDETLKFLGKDKINLGADGGLYYALLDRLMRDSV